MVWASGGGDEIGKLEIQRFSTGCQCLVQWVGSSQGGFGGGGGEGRECEGGGGGEEGEDGQGGGKDGGGGAWLGCGNDLDR